MKELTVKEFVAGYEKCFTKDMKNKYIKNNIKITPYVPIITKDAYASLIVEKTLFEQEKYIAEDDKEKFRKTDKIKVNSVVQYVQFCRVIIKLYTNLIIEDGAFSEEYDALKSSGLLDVLMVGDSCTATASLIPSGELKEFKGILDMKREDALFNETTTQAFVSKQIQRLGDLYGSSITPLINVVTEKVSNVSKEDMNKVIELARSGEFKEV